MLCLSKIVVGAQSIDFGLNSGRKDVLTILGLKWGLGWWKEGRISSRL